MLNETKHDSISQLAKNLSISFKHRTNEKYLIYCFYRLHGFVQQ